jgi:hypothetical protein
MSATAGSCLVRYHGQSRRRRPTSAGSQPERAYQTISSDWIRKPNGTVRSTAASSRLHACPTPRICFPVALDGSMGHRQEYRSMTAAAAARSSVNSARS